MSNKEVIIAVFGTMAITAGLCGAGIAFTNESGRTTPNESAVLLMFVAIGAVGVLITGLSAIIECNRRSQ